MIMHAWSNTSKQREKLSKIFEAVIKIARETETKQEDLYFKWKVITYDTRTEQHQNKSAAKKPRRNWQWQWKRRNEVFRLTKVKVPGQEKGKHRTTFQNLLLKIKEEQVSCLLDQRFLGQGIIKALSAKCKIKTFIGIIDKLDDSYQGNINQSSVTAKTSELPWANNHWSRQVASSKNEFGITRKRKLNRDNCDGQKQTKKWWRSYYLTSDFMPKWSTAKHAFFSK